MVLHILEALETGCARHLTDVVRTVQGWEHHVAVPSERVGGTTDRQAVDRMVAAGATVHRVEMRRFPVHPRNAVSWLQLSALARRLRPAIVHGHSSIGGAHARTITTGAHRAYTPNGLAAGRLARAVERGLGRATDLFVAVSPSERDEVLRRRLVAPGRITVIPNGIEADPPRSEDLRALLSLDAEVPLVGSMGRLSHQKAPEVLVSAFDAVARADPEARFVLIGDGPLRAEVDAAVAGSAHLRTRLHHLPVLPDAAAYLHDLDVFVLASRFEGGPYAPLEAMRAGVPVVATDVVGTRDAVDPTTGVLVPADDPAALAAAVRALLSDAPRRRSLGEAGRATVRDRFDVRQMGTRLAAAYDELLGP